MVRVCVSVRVYVSVCLCAGVFHPLRFSSNMRVSVHNFLLRHRPAPQTPVLSLFSSKAKTLWLGRCTRGLDVKRVLNIFGRASGFTLDESSDAFLHEKIKRRRGARQEGRYASHILLPTFRLPF